MSRIAITGHRGITVATAQLVDAALRTELARWASHTDGELVGISCLANGADQLFARVMLDAGGALEVILPAEPYRAGLPPECWPMYDELLGRANSVIKLDHVESNKEAHIHASEEMLKRADLLFAVWDGKPPRGGGGTASVVERARALGLPVVVIWPQGSTRDY